MARRQSHNLVSVTMLLHVRKVGREAPISGGGFGVVGGSTLHDMDG